jgi:signal transduction histidine kinase
MIADLSASPLFPPIARSCPAGELRWMATARFERGDARFLLVVAGTRSEPMDPGRLHFLPRFVPLLSEALRRRSDSLRARRLEQDLRQAQKLEALGALAGSIAHEINTPMQYIGDNLHFLRDAFGDLVAALDAPGDAAGLAYLRQEVPQALEQSLSGCGRIAEIVEAVRTFAYPDLAQDEDIDIPTILRHCLVMTRSSWKHLVDIDLDFPARVPNVRGGAGQFSQVFVNLITNACHAVGTSPSDPGRVRITVAATADAVLVHVDDNGPGVPAGLRDRIFDQFFTTKELGKGTGQGLGISRGIVERYGGRIELGDSPMGGARFTVSVPLPG